MAVIRKKSSGLYYAVLIGGVVSLNVLLVFNQNVWCDEAFILNACRLGYKELIKYIVDYDMRPPLYLLMAKTFTLIFGNFVPVLKIFSIIPAALTMVLGAVIVDKNWGYGKKTAGTMFILLTGLSPSGLTKNIEITVYSWAMFFTVCSALYAYEVFFHYHNRKKWIVFIISSICGAATHYYALVAEVFIYLVLAVVFLAQRNGRIKGWLIAAAVTAAGYIPVLPCLIFQFRAAKRSFWVESVGLSTLLKAIRMPFEGENVFVFSNDFTVIIWAGVIGAFFYYMTAMIKGTYHYKKEAVYSCLLLAVIAFFLTSGYAISKLIRPLFVDRYIYVAVGLLWLYISIMLPTYIKNDRAVFWCFGLILLMGIAAYPVVLSREYTAATKQAVVYMNSCLSEGDILINNAEECASWELEYYFPGHECYLNCDEGIYYKDEAFDFSQMEGTAWYMCKGDLDLDVDVLNGYGLSVEKMNDINFDNYYYFTVYKVYSDK